MLGCAGMLGEVIAEVVPGQDDGASAIPDIPTLTKYAFRHHNLDDTQRSAGHQSGVIAHE
jgi:hypothetical protein